MVRFTLVPGFTDDAANVEGIAKFVAPMKNVQWVEVQPFHQLGAFKWKAMNLEYKNANTPTRHRTLLLASSNNSVLQDALFASSPFRGSGFCALPCPLWVNSQHMQRKRDVRFAPKADMCGALAYVRFVPIADIRLVPITYVEFSKQLETITS